MVSTVVSFSGSIVQLAPEVRRRTQPLDCLSTCRFEIHNGNILRLFHVKEEDEGMYTCTSENSVGKTEAFAMLQVHGKNSRNRAPGVRQGNPLVHLNHARVDRSMATVWCVFVSAHLCRSFSSSPARSLC